MRPLYPIVAVLFLLFSAHRAVAQATGDPFQMDRLVEVKIELPDEDWDKLRHEHHHMFGVKGPRDRSRPRPSPYHYYKGNVTIDGTPFLGVGLRKKGLLGSVNSRRPSLKINFDKFGGTEEYRGISLMTLNNNESDSSQVKQALSYAIFRQAGIPAPRCNFASVSVNGQSLGVYTHVESIRKDFLRHHFDRASGSLYEGQGSDFNERSIGTFEAKTKRADPAGLQSVRNALIADDHELFRSLERVIHLEQFFRFWALESLVGHNDGYSGNQNNFYLYQDPTIDRFVFLPWGTDGTFRTRSGKSSQKGTPLSVLGEGLLANRLYQTTRGRERYREELLTLFEDVWDEDRILTHMDEIVALVENDLHLPPAIFERAVDSVRRFVVNRRAQLAGELKGPVPTFPKRSQTRSRSVRKKRLRMEGQFSVNWSQSLQSVSLGKRGTVSLLHGSEAVPIRESEIQAGPNPSGSRYQFPVLLLKSRTVSGQAIVLRLLVDPDFFVISNRIPIDGEFSIRCNPFSPLRFTSVARDVGDKTRATSD